MKLSEVIRILEEVAPPRYAKADDKIGLQVGDPEQEIHNIIVTVDATPAVIEEAARRSAQLIVAHHPLVFVPMPTVRTDRYPQSLVYKLIASGVSLYVMHTNFDAADGGINDVLAEKLGVTGTTILEPIYTSRMSKVVTFVPEEALDNVRIAMAEAGAGEIGDYTYCSFAAPGIGTFMPMPGADPYVGTVGELEMASELRLEMIAPEEYVEDVIQAIREAHPYEEVAYDVYPLQNKGYQTGLGLVGKLRNAMTFEGFCEMVRDVLEVDDARVAGDPSARVETVALLGGGGGTRVELASRSGADVYVTGDVNHHQFLQAQALGLNIIDATHFRTERPGMVALAPKLQALLEDSMEVEYVDDVTLLGG